MSTRDDLTGQWLGLSTGEPDGYCVLDIERIGGVQRGIARFFPAEPDSIATTTGFLEIGNLLDGTELVPIEAFVPERGEVLSQEYLQTYLPDVDHADRALISFEALSDGRLKAIWKTESRTEGAVEFERIELPDRSRIPGESEVGNWEEFRREMSSLDFDQFIFRGQSKPKPLQTSFHRTNRKILERFLEEDLRELHFAITAISKHFFDIENSWQRGAFVNLAQHHGYPTPLLDWTKSPFVAAWFAFSPFANSKEIDDETTVRVFALDRKLFEKTDQYQTLTLAPPHLSMMQALAIENDRATPQQGVLTMTNMHDIEALVLTHEKNHETRYLRAYDLPANSVKEVLNELAMMGITHSTMFPGIESSCRDLRYRRFGY